MNFLNEYFLSFFAGVISFFSPCILPLFPVYLSTLGLNNTNRKKFVLDPILLNTLLFTISFSLVFILLALTTTSIGMFLNLNKIILIKTAGILIILFGIFNLQIIKIPKIYKSFHLVMVTRNGIFKPIIFGLCFGLAWTPCIGPILASIISYSSIEKNYQHSSIMLLFYSLGLGIPFILGSLGYKNILLSLNKSSIFTKYFNFIMASILIIFGALVYLNKLYLLNVYIQKTMSLFN